MKALKQGERMKPVGFQLSAEMLAAVDREAERLRAEHPGVTVTRGDVVRAALHRQLLAVKAA